MHQGFLHPKQKYVQKTWCPYRFPQFGAAGESIKSSGLAGPLGSALLIRIIIWINDWICRFSDTSDRSPVDLESVKTNFLLTSLQGKLKWLPPQDVLFMYYDFAWLHDNTNVYIQMCNETWNEIEIDFNLSLKTLLLQTKRLSIIIRSCSLALWTTCWSNSKISIIWLRRESNPGGTASNQHHTPSSLSQQQLHHTYTQYGSIALNLLLIWSFKAYTQIQIYRHNESQQDSPFWRSDASSSTLCITRKDAANIAFSQSLLSSVAIGEMSSRAKNLRLKKTKPKKNNIPVANHLWLHAFSVHLSNLNNLQYKVALRFKHHRRRWQESFLQSTYYD